MTHDTVPEVAKDMLHKPYLVIYISILYRVKLIHIAPAHNRGDGCSIRCFSVYHIESSSLPMDYTDKAGT